MLLRSQLNWTGRTSEPFTKGTFFPENLRRDLAGQMRQECRCLFPLEDLKLLFYLTRLQLTLGG